LFLVASINVAEANDGLMRDISVNSSTAHVEPTKKELADHGVGPSVHTDSGEVISTTFDHLTQYHLELADGDSPGTHSIAFEIAPEHRDASQPQKSKIEMNVIRTDDQAKDKQFHNSFILKDDKEDYLEYSFKIDSAYTTPTQWVLHMQVFQCCAPENPDPALRTQPPLVFQVDPGSADENGVNLSLIARNDTYVVKRPDHSTGFHLKYLDGQDHMYLKKGVWYRLAFAFRPHAGAEALATVNTPSGHIAMWVDGKQVLEYRGSWGYTQKYVPSRQGYAIKLGIYRAAQPTRQKVYFEGIRWGDTLDAVKTH
jgi:Polysaccharide lyase